MAEWNCFLCVDYHSGTACTFCDDGSKFRKMTNADRIRSMNDAELAEFLDNVFNNVFDGYEFPCEDCRERINCDVCFADWLKEEVGD